MCKKAPVTFKDISNRMGLNENVCRVIFSFPPVLEEITEKRFANLMKLLLKRLPNDRVLQNGENEPAVKRVIMGRSDVLILISFQGMSQWFPLRLRRDFLTGHTDAIVQRTRKLEKELPGRIETWVNERSNRWKNAKSVC